MKDFLKKQSQFELFPGTEGASPKRDKMGFFPRHFRFSFENVIVISVSFILGVIVAFSFGVEKGKTLHAKRIPRQPASVLVQKDADSVVEGQSVVLQEDKRNISAQTQIRSDSQETENILNLQENEKNGFDLQKTVDKTPSLEKIHTIQVASFKRLDQAQSLADNLKKEGRDAFTDKKGNYYIVCVGHFSAKKEAMPLMGILKKRYSDCYIRSL